MKGGSESRVEKRIVITADSDIDQDKVQKNMGNRVIRSLAGSMEVNLA